MSARMWELPHEKREAGSTNGDCEHRVPVPGSADHAASSAEKSKGIISLPGKDETC